MIVIRVLVCSIHYSLWSNRSYTAALHSHRLLHRAKFKPRLLCHPAATQTLKLLLTLSTATQEIK